MYSTSGVLFLTLVLSATLVNGMKLPNTRCLCIGARKDSIHPNRIEKLEVFPMSPKCDRLEIVVTLKETNEKLCLNPDSKQVKRIVGRMIQKRSSTKK
ncbi:C-X-C motif chemokine 10-like [Acipenser oxyrinchus oxyrinchus]|uniref:C-X-C motif chemokine n=1 Tax=Acipenser oxyrinchus oxyrinchus TaxID=40147 RepID=A0AAD8GGX2_ACIOX|nr:C-X-C motif chemokine 10-like [Acipenser oxyrinchus oxyrinchus]